MSSEMKTVKPDADYKKLDVKSVNGKAKYVRIVDLQKKIVYTEQKPNLRVGRRKRRQRLFFC